MDQTSSKEAEALRPSAPLPPAMAEIKSQTADQVLEQMNRVPLFMTTLDESDGSGGENIELEALKALAYEGTRAEVAENFRQQGNECAREKKWVDAREFYDKAIAALKAPRKPQDAEEPEIAIEAAEVDEEAEAVKEKEIEEACYINRALCNLEKKNYGSCIRDCAATLRLNPANIKALYRSGSACLALDKLPEASDACARGLQLDASNAALQALSKKISACQAHLEAVEKARREREERAAVEKQALAVALRSRNIATRQTEQIPDLEDATIQLSEALNPSSNLTFPTILLYPLHSQSDFIKAFGERESLGDHLAYIFPLPWDQDSEYAPDKVDGYMETKTGGLIKVGKKVALGKVLGSGKCEIVDGLVKIHVVPKANADDWIQEFKKRKTV